MIKVPGEGHKPYVPPPVTSKEAKPKEQNKQEEMSKPLKPIPKEAEIGKGPRMDARAMAVRLAALATEAKRKDIDKELKFGEILQQVIEMTGMPEAESAMEEASRKLQKEIEATLEEIKSNKDLMEEAGAWQDFAELLESNLSEEQLKAFFGMLKESVKNM